MNSLTDGQLLRDYTGRRSEGAFAELVRRHVDLVYSAASRMVRDAHLAEDVTQAVFVALAQNARQLSDRPVLSGWLHRTTQNLAANAVRSEVRRRAREQEAAAINELLSAEPDATWEHIAPHLDAALGELSEPDRDALLLRYFERKSASEMAQTLGISDEAAQKRVSRAVERLRESFAKRGVTVGASGLVVLISANAVQAAPIGLAATISTAAALVGTTIATTATATVTKAIAMTTLQKTLITATMVAAVGTGAYQAHQASSLRNQVQLLQQQQAEQTQQLQRERDEAMAKQAQLQDKNARSNRNNAELLRLRAEVARMRKEVASANLNGKNNAASQDLQPLTEQAPANPSPVEIYSATARAVVPWNQALITGGWKTLSGKIVYVLAVPTRGEDAGMVTITANVIEVSVDTATKLGLDKSNTGDKETKLSVVLTTELCQTIAKAANDTNNVAIISSPRAMVSTGNQATVQSMDNKETPVGEKYSVGPTLTFMPTISADGQSVDLGMIANVNYPSPTANP